MNVRLQLLSFAMLAVPVTFHQLQAQEKAIPAPVKADESPVKVDAKLPEYKAVKGVSGDLQFNGSDTMIGEVSQLAESFKKLYSNVTIGIEGEGSSFGPPALITGKAQFIAMSRAMKAKEVDDFKKKFGYPPVALPTSIDMLTVYVHQDNPIKGLTLQQVDAIFSRTLKGGSLKILSTWGDLGLTGEWSDKPITLYGRNAASGTNRFFREHALFNGAFREEVQELTGSSSVVQGVANNKYAIGYSGMGTKTEGVRAIPLAQDIKSEYFAPIPEHAYSGDYPLTRFLFLYVNHAPGTEPNPLNREFLLYLYSQQGQSDVVRSGFLPVGEVIATRALATVGIQNQDAATK